MNNIPNEGAKKVWSKPELQHLNGNETDTPKATYGIESGPYFGPVGS